MTWKSQYIGRLSLMLRPPVRRNETAPYKPRSSYMCKTIAELLY